MHYMLSILFAVLSISACTTCPTNKVIADGLTKSIVRQLNCPDYNKIHADLMDLCDDHNLCSDTKIIPIEAIPAGSWSEAGLSCHFITGSIQYTVIKPSKSIVNNAIVDVPQWKVWGCKHGSLDPDGLDKMCEKL